MTSHFFRERIMKLFKFFSDELEKLFKILRIVYSKSSFKSTLLKLIKNQRKAFKIRKRYKKMGVHIPPMLLISVTEKCNLRCKGCYSKHIEENCIHDGTELSIEDYTRIFDEARKLGISIITLVGGEPLLRKDLIELCAKYNDIIFPIYTNGLLLGEHYKKLFLANRNLLPFFSIEGYKDDTDERRGSGVYDLVLEKMKWAKESNLLYGVSITVTSLNLDTVTSDDFVKMLDDLGCIYISYVEFEAMDENTSSLKLTTELRHKHLANLKIIENKYKKIFFTSYPDFEYRSGGCLGAGKGFIHINAYGDVEPCNFVPISDCNLKNKTILEALQSPLFKKLIEEGLLENNHNGACALLSNKDKLAL